MYKTYKNKLNHVIKTAKKVYYENQFIKYKNDIKMTWQKINEVLNRRKTKSKLPDTFLQKIQTSIFQIQLILQTNLMNIL